MIKSIIHLYNATKYSLAGLKCAWQTEWAFRLEVAILLLSIPGVFFIASDALHRFILLGSVVLILICELLNSAIENLTDRISLEKHPLSKNSKDLGSASVFVACIFAACIWVWSFLDCVFESAL